MADRRLDQEEDLTDLIAAAIGYPEVEPFDDELVDDELSEDEPSSVHAGSARQVEDPTEPMVAVTYDEERSLAFEAYSSARVAVVSGQLSHARSLMEQAVRLDPGDDQYRACLDDLRERERKADLEATRAAIREEREAGLAEERRPRRWKVLLAGLGAAVLCAIGAHVLLADGDALPDLSEDFRYIADFESLVRVPGGGWMATLDEQFWSQPPAQRQARCRAILRELPPSDVPALALKTTDGMALACRR